MDLLSLRCRQNEHPNQSLWHYALRSRKFHQYRVQRHSTDLNFPRSMKITSLDQVKWLCKGRQKSCSYAYPTGRGIYCLHVKKGDLVLLCLFSGLRIPRFNTLYLSYLKRLEIESGEQRRFVFIMKNTGIQAYTCRTAIDCCYL